MKVSVDSGAAEHVMLEGMFQRVKLERKTSPKRFVVANGEQIRETWAKDYSIQDKRGNSKLHNIEECRRGQTSPIFAESRPNWKYCGAG